MKNVAYLNPEFNSAVTSPVSGALIDWLSVTIQLPPPSDLHRDYLIGELSQVLDIPQNLIAFSDKGWMGYTSRLLLGAGSCYGFVAFGGESQRNTVSIQLTGTYCKTRESWNELARWCIRHSGKITRVDVAYDDFDGSEITLPAAKQLFLDGKFRSSNGRAPNGRYIDDLGSDAGCTLYVGDRRSGKFCRIYEKGKQLGDKTSPWVRVEVEYRSKDRLIGWDVLDFPGDYLSGAYEPFSVFSAKQSVIKTIKNVRKASIVAAKDWFRSAAGSTINLLLKYEYGGDVSQLFDDAVRMRIPARFKNYFINDGVSLNVS